MNLRDYPRPDGDNGIGLHFRLDLRPRNVEQGVEWLQQIRARWTLIGGQDWNQIVGAAQAVHAVGIQPVCRLITKIDRYNDFVDGVTRLKQAGIIPYIQIFNEPGDDREWRGKPDIGRYGEAWANSAALVYDAGGFPGIQVLGPDEWLAAFNAVQANGRMDIWDRAWFCLHNGGANHPPNYPYDDVNLNGTPVDQATYDQNEWRDTFEGVNVLRQSNCNPNATIMTDDTAVLRFFEYKQWMIDSLGYSLPLIGGEAGWAPGANEDIRYPKLNDARHAAYHREMYEWFRKGVVSNGQPLPDELFSVSDWIMGDWGADDWWNGTLGTKQETIDAVTAIPAFTRKFSWDQAAGGDPAPQPINVQPIASGDIALPPVATQPPTGDNTASQPVATTPSTPGETASQPAASTPPSGGVTQTTPAVSAPRTYTVQHGDTLSAIAKKFETTVAAIVAANNIHDPNKIRTGQVLTIP